MEAQETEQAEAILEVSGVSMGFELHDLIDYLKTTFPGAGIKVRQRIYRIAYCDECGSEYKKVAKDHKFCTTKCGSRKRAREWRRRQRLPPL